MAYANTKLTSIYGRRLAIARMSTSQSGGIKPIEFLVGETLGDIRKLVSTAETTATGLSAAGLSWIVGTSVASTPVFPLDPPIPGIKKIIHFGSTDSKLWVRTKNSSETIRTSGTSTGATFTAITSSAGGSLELVGATTAIWLAVNCPSTLSGISFAATT